MTPASDSLVALTRIMKRMVGLRGSEWVSRFTKLNCCRERASVPFPVNITSSMGTAPRHVPYRSSLLKRSQVNVKPFVAFRPTLFDSCGDGGVAGLFRGIEDRARCGRLAVLFAQHKR